MTWAWISWAKKHCGPDTDAEIAGEVDEAYHFYHMCISAENRKLGQKALAKMRKALARSPAVPKSGHTHRNREKRPDDLRL